MLRLIDRLNEIKTRKNPPVPPTDFEGLVQLGIYLLLIFGSGLFVVLFVEDEHSSFDITILGTRDCWIYKLNSFNQKVKFESHMSLEDDLIVGELVNLEVDKPLILPAHTTLTLYVTSNEGRHSWYNK